MRRENNLFILCRFVLQRGFRVIQIHVLCKYLFKYFIESILCIFVMERYKGHLQHSCLHTSISAKLFGMSENVLVLEMSKMIPEFTTCKNIDNIFNFVKLVSPKLEIFIIMSRYTQVNAN